MKTLNLYILRLSLLCASLQHSTHAEDTKFWLWGVVLPIFDKNCISCGTLARKGSHGLITESFHLHKTNFEQFFDDLNQNENAPKMTNVRGELSAVTIHYCYFLDTKRDIHPFLGIGIGRSSCSFSFDGLSGESAKLQQPFMFWSNPSIIPSIGIHFGQDYWISLLLQAEGNINFMRWSEQFTDIANDISPEALKKLPSYNFSKGITIALAFKIF